MKKDYNRERSSYSILNSNDKISLLSQNRESLLAQMNKLMQFEHNSSTINTKNEKTPKLQQSNIIKEVIKDKDLISLINTTNYPSEKYRIQREFLTSHIIKDKDILENEVIDKDEVLINLNKEKVLYNNYLKRENFNLYNFKSKVEYLLNQVTNIGNDDESILFSIKDLHEHGLESNINKKSFTYDDVLNFCISDNFNNNNVNSPESNTMIKNCIKEKKPFTDINNILLTNEEDMSKKIWLNNVLNRFPVYENKNKKDKDDSKNINIKDTTYKSNEYHKLKQDNKYKNLKNKLKDIVDTINKAEVKPNENFNMEIENLYYYLEILPTNEDDMIYNINTKKEILKKVNSELTEFIKKNISQ